MASGLAGSKSVKLILHLMMGSAGHRVSMWGSGQRAQERRSSFPLLFTTSFVSVPALFLCLVYCLMRYLFPGLLQRLFLYPFLRRFSFIFLLLHFLVVDVVFLVLVLRFPSRF